MVKDKFKPQSLFNKNTSTQHMLKNCVKNICLEKYSKSDVNSQSVEF